MSNYYELLGLDPVLLAQKKEDEIKEEIARQFRAAAMVHHPDKGGDEEMFKELNHARDVLLDLPRRLRYNKILNDQAETEVYEPRSRPQDIPEQNEQSQTFHALIDLGLLRNEFIKFYKARLKDDDIASEHGYASKLTQDPKTGNDILRLTFPDQATAKAFIDLAIAQHWIQDPTLLNEQRAASAARPDPFRRALTY